MKVNISEILSNPSVIKNFKVEPEFEKLKLRRSSYPVSYKEPFVLTVSKTDGTLHVTGETMIRLIIPCDRCLEDVENTFHIKIDRSVDPNTESDGIDDVDELSFIDGYMLDVDKLVTDEIVVALPTKVLCKEDCKGLCSICGTNLNYHTCHCNRASVDPRMAAIQDIFRDFNR
ncbi:MAG: DUF177 domain-containing protein [Lachnospiraceae bacterium]|nr:DUF177 domain-containing protein [Lachnospiraceae bacterium]